MCVCVYIVTTVLPLAYSEVRAGFFRRTILSNLALEAATAATDRHRAVPTATRFQFSFTRRRRQSAADNNKLTTTVTDICSYS